MADANDPLNPDVLPPSPQLVPISSTEYPNYFFPYQRRYFPLYRHPQDARNDPQVQLPSVLPIDRYDMERRTVLHNLVNLGLGHKNWFGPFERHLFPPEGRLVVDVGSNNGRWIEDVSEEVPHAVHFRGIEIFPSSPTEAANNNVRFEVYDFQREQIRHGDASVDVAHARFQNFHIQDWDKFLKDAARCLKPGGLFMSGELDISLEYPDGQAANATATTQLYHQVQRIMVDRGYTPDIGSQMVEKLNTIRDSAGNLLFTNVGSDVFTLPMSANNPIVADREISALSMEYLDRLAKSLRPFLLSTGQVRVEVDGLLQRHREEIRQVSAWMKYRVAWAERRA
ncbi:unnamed protein product [Rhizoctonia solani]|uniref:Methyltransferase type 11 domain-containing protein n=1 Tax=Rhizoctonia solani TaxID=456999 RepID=A0A8H3AXR4_9AGAM|nr:unnamed protein product [Rhizoctonia solani]CAE7141757.1 unnamed protein product [Rhizoctonia solani]